LLIHDIAIRDLERARRATARAPDARTFERDLARTRGEGSRSWPCHGASCNFCQLAAVASAMGGGGRRQAREGPEARVMADGCPSLHPARSERGRSCAGTGRPSFLLCHLFRACLSRAARAGLVRHRARTVATPVRGRGTRAELGRKSPGSERSIGVATRSSRTFRVASASVKSIKCRLEACRCGFRV